MAFGTSGVLAIEVGPNQLRVIHGALSGHRLRVYDFAAEEVLISNPENIAQQLEALVARKRLRSSSAALALSGPGVVHRVMEFPAMPLSELGLVVGREMRAVGGDGGKDIAFDWEVIDESGSGNLKQLRVLVAIASRLQEEEAQQLLVQCHLKPALITTVPIALLRSLRFVQGGGIGLRALLFMGGQQGCLLGVKDGAWGLHRDFSTRQSEEMLDALMEEALREVNRVLLYYRQHYRDGTEMKLFLGGERGLEDLQLRVQNELGIQGEVVKPGPALDLAPLEERANIFRDIFPSFLIPLGLVTAAYGEAGINLVPKAVRKTVVKRPDIDLSFVYRPVSALILLLFFFGLHLILTLTERHYQRILEGRIALYTQWLPAIRAAEESRAWRDNEKLLLQSLGSSRIGETSWVALFKVLSRLVPPELILQSMSIQEDKGQWLITLKGQVVSADSYAAQAAFNRFYQGLKRSHYLEGIELLPLDVSTLPEKVEGPATKNPEGPATGGVPESKAEIKKTKVQFEVRGHSKGI